jgi:transcriptional regulator with XRE-family HTH domain
MPRITEPKTTLGVNIRTRRIMLNWSQEQLAQRAGVTRNTISLLEMGESTYAKADTLYKLACALGVRMEDLLGVPKLRPDRTFTPLSGGLDYITGNQTGDLQ